MKTEKESEHLVVYTEREEGPVCGLDEEMIGQAGGEVRYGKAADERERVRLAEHAEVIVVGGAQMTRELFTALPRL